MVKSNNLVKKTAVMAVTAGVAVGLTMGIAPGAQAAGEKIVFIQGVKGDGFYISMGCGVNAEAKKLGVSAYDRSDVAPAAPTPAGSASSGGK